ncbi:MAG: hypothetical protein WD904_12970 [Dehalococcoidia bacterium]
MGRAFMYAALVALAVFVLSATFVLEHGGASIAAVQHILIHDLTTSPEAYEGTPITTEGTLTFSDEHDRHQLVGDGNLAVIIREYHGKFDLADLEGREVEISGQFGIDDDFGVYIDADFVRLVPN